MEAFILEALQSRGWRRGGEIFWTLDDAKRQGQSLIRAKFARAIRILPVKVALEPVSELPQQQAVA